MFPQCGLSDCRCVKCTHTARGRPCPRISRMITSSHEGATGQAVFCGRFTTRHGCALLGCGSGVKGRSPRERVAEGEPLRPLPQPSYTQNAIRRRPAVHVAGLVTISPSCGATTFADCPVRYLVCVSVRARSSAAAPTPQNLTYGRRTSG